MNSNARMAKPSSAPSHLGRKSGRCGVAAGWATGTGCPGEEEETGAAVGVGCAGGLLGAAAGVGVVTVALQDQSWQARVAFLALFVLSSVTMIRFVVLRTDCLSY